jgi:hypothetical protein
VLREAILKRLLAVASILAVLAAAALASPPPKNEPPQSKVLTGRVLDPGDNPLAGAVVYLTNTRTRAVKTYIAGREGDYRFPGLANNTDYEVYAQFQGHKSDTKSVSQFDARAQVNVNLKIDVK